MGFIGPDRIAQEMVGVVQKMNDDNVSLGFADPNKSVVEPLSVNGHTKPQFSLRSNRLYSIDEFASNLARMKIYHPQEFDQRMSFIDSEIRRRNEASIRTAYNNAFKSRVYLDAMKNYELRQQYPDRYVPAGFESLQNLDIYAERGRMLQRRSVLGRRRSQSLGGEQAQQQETL